LALIGRICDACASSIPVAGAAVSASLTARMVVRGELILTPP
jgi:hypothetical protein